MVNEYSPNPSPYTVMLIADVLGVFLLHNVFEELQENIDDCVSLTVRFVTVVTFIEDAGMSHKIASLNEG